MDSFNQSNKLLGAFQAKNKKIYASALFNYIFFIEEEKIFDWVILSAFSTHIYGCLTQQRNLLLPYTVCIPYMQQFVKP